MTFRSWIPVALLAASVVGSAAFGLLNEDSYPGVSELQRQTWRAQDAVNLVTVVLLVVTKRLSAAGSWRGHVAHVGLLAWFAYCYFHLAFGAVFGPMFLVYLAAAGLAGFGFIDGLVRVDLSRPAARPSFPRRSASAFFAVTGVGIAGLWLSEVVPGVIGISTPPNIHLGGLPNPTWVLDLVWLIPWALATVWQLSSRHRAAQLNAVALLVLLTVLSTSMLAVTPFALSAGLGPDPIAGPQLVAFSVVFGVLGTIEAVLLWFALRGRGRQPLDSTRSWWPGPEAKLTDAG
jgi:hypothetical protein